MIKNKVVSFDLDGTITDQSFVDSVWLEGIPQLYSVKKKVSFDEAKIAVKKEYDKVGNEKLQWYNLQYWIKKFDLNVSWQQLLSHFEDKIKIYPDALKAIEELAQKGIRLIIITNANTEFLEFQLASTNTGDYFEAVFSVTSDFGLVKKTVDAYQRVCKILGILPHEMIHVGDDRKFDFYVPQRLGISAFHLDRKGTNKGKHVIYSLQELNKIVEKL
ncbi:MAG: HAD family hydrolase [Candidatus Bathyarchaeota archaeon]|nr:HAD family hydrolase [Candidatus Bathyarchaeota archaeon]